MLIDPERPNGVKTLDAEKRRLHREIAWTMYVYHETHIRDSSYTYIHAPVYKTVRYVPIIVLFGSLCTLWIHWGCKINWSHLVALIMFTSLYLQRWFRQGVPHALPNSLGVIARELRESPFSKVVLFNPHPGPFSVRLWNYDKFIHENGHSRDFMFDDLVMFPYLSAFIIKSSFVQQATLR